MLQCVKHASHIEYYYYFQFQGSFDYGKMRRGSFFCLLEKYFFDSICANMTHVLKKIAGDVEDFGWQM